MQEKFRGQELRRQTRTANGTWKQHYNGQIQQRERCFPGGTSPARPDDPVASFNPIWGEQIRMGDEQIGQPKWEPRWRRAI